jgi:hypothetical protein
MLDSEMEVEGRDGQYYMQAYINWKFSVNALLVGAIRFCLPPVLD